MCCSLITLMAQDILGSDQQVDRSGNPILKDAGVWLRNELKANVPDIDMKYIDPSYLIRSIPTISGDRIYCKVRLCPCAVTWPLYQLTASRLSSSSSTYSCLLHKQCGCEADGHGYELHVCLTSRQMQMT